MRKARRTFREFLRDIPELGILYMSDPEPDKPIDDTCVIKVDRDRYMRAKERYLKAYPFYTFLAKVLRKIK